MNNLVIASLFILAGCGSTFAEIYNDGVPATTNIPLAKYPSVDSDSKATFKLFAPDAKDVKVDICGKKYDMIRDEDGETVCLP